MPDRQNNYKQTIDRQNKQTIDRETDRMNKQRIELADKQQNDRKTDRTKQMSDRQYDEQQTIDKERNRQDSMMNKKTIDQIITNKTIDRDRHTDKNKQTNQQQI